MKIIFSIFFCVTTAIFSFSQKAPIKFGDVPMQDMKMTVYSKDSSASAVVLADFGESRFVYNSSEGFKIEFERIRRIKILTKDGLEWADFSIPLYHNSSSSEKFLGLKAITYNLENGKIVETKLKSESILKEKYDANLDITKVTWPNVKVGSVLEISYRVSSEFLFNFQDWEFQSTIPIIWSEYRAQIPEYFNYEKYMQGYVALAINENNTVNNSISITSSERSEGRVTNTTFTQDKIDFLESRFRWAAKDVSAFKPEPFMTTSNDYISKINFEISFTNF